MEALAPLARRLRCTHLAGLEERSVHTSPAAVPRRRSRLVNNEGHARVPAPRFSPCPATCSSTHWGVGRCRHGHDAQRRRRFDGANRLRREPRIVNSVVFTARDRPERARTRYGRQAGRFRRRPATSSARCQAKPLDDPALSLVAVRMIGECGGNDLIDFAFIAGSFVADRHGLRVPDGVIQLNILASRCRNSVRTSAASPPSTAPISSSAVANFSASLASGRESDRYHRDKDEHHCGRSDGGIADGPHDADDAIDPARNTAASLKCGNGFPSGTGTPRNSQRGPHPWLTSKTRRRSRGTSRAHLLIVLVEDFNGHDPVFEPAMKQPLPHPVDHPMKRSIRGFRNGSPLGNAVRAK